MERNKKVRFLDDLQGIEENLADLLIDSWLKNNLTEFVVALEILNNLTDLEKKISD